MIRSLGNARNQITLTKKQDMKNNKSKDDINVFWTWYFTMPIKTAWLESQGILRGWQLVLVPQDWLASKFS